MKKLLVYIVLFYPFVSFAQKAIPNKIQMCEILTEMIHNDQLYRSKLPNSFSGDESEYSEQEIKSMGLLQREIDNHNTEKLIELTKEYGWISDERIDCPELNIWLIFRHAQSKYFDEISELIEKEHQENRLNDFYYSLIHDHLNGRPRG
jgi:hypothetical protein